MFSVIVGAVLSLVLLHDVHGSYEHDKGSRCYDCNYAPSGYVLSKNGYTSGHVGYQSCALQSDYDRRNVDKWGCASGKCFIRRDYNGLVYRGCADDDNLPWGVDSHTQCQYQGDNKSLWWFCEGDLCNEGQLGDNAALCGTPITVQSQNGNQNQAHSNGKNGQAPNGYGFNEVDMPTYDTQDQSSYVHISFDMAGQGDNNQVFTYAANVCNGDCSYNPTGLYSFPSDASKFIQCEAANINNNACTCCKATTLSCPHGTLYDDTIKVCVGHKGHLQGLGYQ